MFAGVERDATMRNHHVERVCLIGTLLRVACRAGCGKKSLVTCDSKIQERTFLRPT